MRLLANLSFNLSMAGFSPHLDGDVQTPGSHASEIIPAPPLPCHRIQDVRANVVGNEDDPVPAGIPPPIDRDNRKGLNRAPTSEQNLLSGDP